MSISVGNDLKSFFSTPDSTKQAPTVVAKGGTLTLTCSKCTRYASFGGDSREECAIKATRAGWHMRKDKAICSRCPK